MSTHSSVIYCFLYVFCGNLALLIGQHNAIYGRYLWSQSDYCCATGYFFISFLLCDLFLLLILLFILVHLYGVSMSRLGEGCTPLLWPQLLLLPALWTALKLKIDKKTKRSCYCFCSNRILLIIVNLLHAMMIEWLNKTIQTTLCRWLTCTTTIYT